MTHQDIRKKLLLLLEEQFETDTTVRQDVYEILSLIQRHVEGLPIKKVNKISYDLYEEITHYRNGYDAALSDVIALFSRKEEKESV